MSFQSQHGNVMESEHFATSMMGFEHWAEVYGWDKEVPSPCPDQPASVEYELVPSGIQAKDVNGTYVDIAVPSKASDTIYSVDFVEAT